MMSFANEIAFQIYKYLDISDLDNLRLVSKKFYELASNDYIWRLSWNQLAEYLPPPPKDNVRERLKEVAIELKKSIKKFSIEHLPSNLISILNKKDTPTLDEIQFLLIAKGCGNYLSL